MRRIVPLLLANILVILLFSSCSLERIMSEDGPSLELENANEDDWFKKIVNAVKEQDATALKEVFSEKAVIDAVDIDESARLLFDFIQGEVVSYQDRDSSRVSAAKDREGHIWKEIKTNFILKTDEKTYRLALQGYSVDTGNPDNIGVYSLYIVEAQGYDIYEGYWGDGQWTPGIVIEKNE